MDKVRLVQEVVGLLGAIPGDENVEGGSRYILFVSVPLSGSSGVVDDACESWFLAVCESFVFLRARSRFFFHLSWVSARGFVGVLT